MKCGFTLIEILVVIGLVIGIFAIGSVVDFSNLGRQSLASEQQTLVSILQKARSRAMNNIDHTEHGVRIDPDKFVIYTTSLEENISRNTEIAITGIDDVVFTQLSGAPDTTGDIVLSDGLHTKTITINDAGLIDW